MHPLQQATTPPAPPAQLGGDPAALYRALRDQRDVLGDQRQSLEGRRSELQQEYDQISSSNPGRDGITKRIQQIDARLTEIDQQIAASDKAVATQAAVPGATVEPPRPPRGSNPDPDLIAGLGFVIVLVFALPISIAYARRIWRKSARAEVVLPAQMNDRMESLERGVEAIALEVERIGESQRFLTQTMTERLDARVLGAGAAQAIPVKQGERMEQRR